MSVIRTTFAVNPSDLDLDVLLKRLHLANTRRNWPDLVARAEQDQWSYRDFLALLVAEEVAHRNQTRVQRLVRQAGFPFLKTIEDFDFSLQSILRPQLLRRMTSGGVEVRALQVPWQRRAGSG